MSEILDGNCNTKLALDRRNTRRADANFVEDIEPNHILAYYSRLETD